MRSSLVFVFSALGASAAMAATPAPVVGSWRALPARSADVGRWQAFPAPSAEAVIGVIGIPQVLTFTDDGRLWIAQRLPARPPYKDYLLGRYTASDGKVVAKGPSGETYAYELMKDGRLCVYPGPGMVPLAGAVKPQEAGRQCYERLQNPA